MGMRTVYYCDQCGDNEDECGDLVGRYSSGRRIEVCAHCAQKLDSERVICPHCHEPLDQMADEPDFLDGLCARCGGHVTIDEKDKENRGNLLMTEHEYQKLCEEEDKALDDWNRLMAAAKE